jgi:hypothetical protein
VPARPLHEAPSQEAFYEMMVPPALRSYSTSEPSR